MILPKMSLLLLLASSIFLVSGEGTIRGGSRMSALDEPEDHEGRSLITETSNSGMIADEVQGFTVKGTTKKYCVASDNRTYAMSYDERMNARWMNQARAAKGLRSMRFDADLVVEAQRWAKYMASKKAVRTRDNIFRNVFCGTYNEIGEYDLSHVSASRTGGAFDSMMQGDGRDFILYAPYDKMGIGIAKNGTRYYFAILFKDHN